MTLASSYFNGYVSDIEILWTLIALGGLVFSIYNIREAFNDVAALKLRKIKNGRMKIAMVGLKAELGRAIIQTIFLAVGILAMNFQDPPVQIHEPFKVALFRFVFQWGFILSGLILALKSYWNFQLRRDLMEHGIQLEPHELDRPPREDKSS